MPHQPIKDPMSANTATIDPPRSLRTSADSEIAAFVAKASSKNLHKMPALSAFSSQMERYPELSPDAQLDLVEKCREGRKASEQLRSNTVLTVSEKRELRKVVRAGEKSANYLVGATFRLVLLICSEKARKRFGPGRVAEKMPDLVAEANVAVSEAIINFDEEKIPVFHTYVARVVRDRIQYTLSREGTIRLAPSWERLKRLASFHIPNLESELGRKPTDQEIHDRLMNECRKWAYKRLTVEQQALPESEREDLMMTKLRKQGMLGALRDLSEVRVAAQSVTSLDAPLGKNGDSGALGDIVPDMIKDTTFDAVEMMALTETLLAALGELSNRERQIIALRFGLAEDSDGEQATYAQIGAAFDVTAERIRQIERSVLDKLATSSPMAQSLKGFLQ